MSLFYLLYIVFVIVDFFYFICFVFLVVFGYLYLIVKIISNKYFKFLSSIFFFLVSIGVIFFVLILQNLSAIDYVVLIFVGSIVVFSFLSVVLNNKIIFFISIAVLFISFLLFVTFFYSKMFFWTIVLMFCLLAASSFSLKSVFVKNEEFSIKINVGKVKMVIFLFLVVSAGYLMFPVRYVEIKATNRPQFIFWSDAVSTPTDEEKLSEISESNVGFCVVLRPHYVDDGGLSEKKHIEYLLNHSIDVYVCIGGESGSFYLSTDNGEYFFEYYKYIKNWMILNNLFQSDYFRGFVFDAETPGDLIGDVEDKGTVEKVQYFIDHSPSDRDMERIEKEINKISDDCKTYSKKLGIIKLPTFFDNSDGDYDYSRLSRNVYEIDVPWDFSVAMIYRTLHNPNIYDYLLNDMSEYDYTTDYEPSYFSKSDLEKNVMPITTFYQKVSYEISTSEVNVDEGNRYVFVGNFNKKFKDTSYIVEKEYIKDVDICRSFGVSKIWLYEWSSFDRTYDFDELDNLCDHGKHNQSWFLYMPYFSITRETLMVVLIMIIDRIIIL